MSKAHQVGTGYFTSGLRSKKKMADVDVKPELANQERDCAISLQLLKACLPEVEIKYQEYTGRSKMIE